MTMVILSPPRTSTSGRAPVFSATIRFWISVESLNRPPTLLTIASSFKSSSMVVPFELTSDNIAECGDGLVQVVVDHFKIILSSMGQLPLGRRYPALNGGLIFGAALAQALLVDRQRGGAQKNRHLIGTLLPHLS